MTQHRIGIVGGTGPLGRGLAYRFARAGHAVTLGSRSHDRAVEAAEALNRRTGGAVRGAVNAVAAEASDVVVLAIPWEGLHDVVTGLMDQLAGKVVVSCASPLDLPDGGSAAEATALLLPDSRVVAAFHHLSAAALTGDADHQDVLVCGDDAGAKRIVLDLAATVTGRVGGDAGALRLARLLESFTAVLISVNRRYRTDSGVTVTLRRGSP